MPLLDSTFDNDDDSVDNADVRIVDVDEDKVSLIVCIYVYTYVCHYN